MLYRFTEEELRSICRRNLESLEKWARTIVDMKLSKAYGENYFSATIKNNEPLIKKSIRDKVSEMLKSNPDIFSKEIDTLYLDEMIIYNNN